MNDHGFIKLMKRNRMLKLRSIHSSQQLRLLLRANSRPTQIIAAATCIILLAGAFLLHYAAASLEDSIRQQHAGALQLQVETAHESINLWVLTQMRLVEKIADAPQIATLTHELLKIQPTPDALAQAQPQKQLRALMEPELELIDSQGIFIIGPNNVSLASMRDTNLGIENYLTQHHPDKLREAWAGQTVVIPPIASDVPLGGVANDQLQRSLFLATPVIGRSGLPVAIFTIRLDAAQTIDRMVTRSSGHTKIDTYAFDHSLRFVTEPDHYAKQLDRIQKPDHTLTFLEAQVRQMDGDKQIGEPTLLAKQVLKGGHGAAAQSYVGYYGQPVIGAWAWNPLMGVGIAAEIAEADALASYAQVYRYIKILTYTVFGFYTVMIVLSFVFAQVSNRMAKALRTDPLTQIASRGYFDLIIHEQFRVFQRSELPLSLLLIDVDQFKSYNDTYGHLAGDECLKTVAECLSEACERETDLAARYGGEEFAVLLPMTDAAGAASVAWKIQRGLRSLQILHEASDVSEYVTVSMGIATAHPHDRLSCSQELIRAADQNLYRAKDASRNCIFANNESALSDDDATQPLPLRIAG